MTYYDFFGAPFPTPASLANWETQQPAGATLYGTARGDQIPDNDGGNTLVGGTGDDLYLIVDSGSTIVENAGEGLDSVTAYTNFRLPANVEILNLQADLVTGVANDTGSMLSASGSRDVLVGGEGNDILVDRTTDKQNIFQIDPSSGKDAIYGFTATGANHDLIRLNYTQFTSFDALKGAMTQVGSDVRIDMDANDAVLLKNVHLADLDSDDFLLPFSPSNLRMTFDDEFNSLAMDTGAPNSWNSYYRYGPANGAGSLAARTLPHNGEQEVYVDPTYAGDPSKSSGPLGLNPFSIDNGVLSITASKLDATDSAKLWNYQYDSGVLTTDKTFSQTYGYFEIKAELPQEKGMFPAFWLLPTAQAWPPEIDIMENVGQNFASGGAISPDGSDAFRTWFPDGETGMHTYGLLWTAETITWYVDGNAVGSVPTPASMHQPMYMIVNLAVGGDWAGPPDPDFASASMKIDYVRAYSLDAVAGGSSSPAEPVMTSAMNGMLVGTDAHEMMLGSSGSDTLIGGGGNDHLYGLSPSGGADAGDSLSGGDGSDYLQGNAGNDTLDGGNGSDRLNGGADDDLIAGGDGNDSLNGNRGNDSLSGDAGNDLLRGGQGNDSLDGGDGNDTLSGDLGQDVLTGGAGIDTFLFSGQASPLAAPDRITDFTPGVDHLSLGFAPAALLTGAPQASLAAAASLAQSLFDQHAGDHEVAALGVGGDTYLFYSSTAGATVDSAILLSGVAPASLASGDF